MTASHLPYTRNGLKFFTKKGGLTSPEVEEICDRAARKYANRVSKVSTMLKSPPTRVDFMSSYICGAPPGHYQGESQPSLALRHSTARISGISDDSLIITCFLPMFVCFCFLFLFHHVTAYVQNLSNYFSKINARPLVLQYSLIP
jgi:hypothetical protein